MALYKKKNSIDIFGLSCTKELKKNMNKANRELRKNEGYIKTCLA